MALFNKQTVFNLDTIQMSPLALLYLLAIYNGDFDKRLHMGHFQTNSMFKERIQDLMNLGYIGYDGQHFMKPKGTNYVMQVLLYKPEL